MTLSHGVPAAPCALALVLEQVGAAMVVVLCAATAALSAVCFATLGWSAR